MRNLSKSKPNCNGSTSVILTTQANIDHAPDHLPGPTTIVFFFAQLTKSATIRKYELNHISLITLSSYSKRATYSPIVQHEVCPPTAISGISLFFSIYCFLKSV